MPPKFSDESWNNVFRPTPTLPDETTIQRWRDERADLGSRMSNARTGTHGQLARRIMELSDLISKAEAG